MRTIMSAMCVPSCHSVPGCGVCHACHLETSNLQKVCQRVAVGNYAKPQLCHYLMNPRPFFFLLWFRISYPPLKEIPKKKISLEDVTHRCKMSLGLWA